ncbi:hypothetical protein [Paenibacillus apis]|nr:hypothetical protein [Paenibacillus apis]
MKNHGRSADNKRSSLRQKLSKARIFRNYENAESNKIQTRKRNLMYKVFKVICFSVLLVLMSGCGHDTLQDAVQAKWKSPVFVKNIDQENQLVIYLDQTQYVFGVYEKKNGKYFYDNSQSSGWSASTKDGIPFFVSAEYKKNIGNFIWGAVYTDIPIEKIFIEYENGLTQETVAVNNTFMLEMPSTFNSTEPIMFMGELYDVTAYDKKGNEIVSWRN